MVENGYLAQDRSMHDRRSIHVKLTEKAAVAGPAERNALAAYQNIGQTAGTPDDLEAAPENAAPA